MPASESSECCFAAEAILKRSEVVARQVAGVRANRDVEAVHDLRVASRRLRTALELFADCLPARKARPWGKAIRRVTRALGQARDSDVQIEFVADFLQHVEDRRLRPGIQRLLLRLRQRREALQEDVIEALDRLEASGALGQLEEVLAPVQAHAQLGHVDTLAACVRDRAGAAIAGRLERMLAYEPYVRQPEAVEPLHAMRIAAKHLRYAMEIFRPLYGEEFSQRIESVRRVQQHLGDLHDCDVWIAFLPEFLEQERKRMLEYFGHARAIGRFVPGIEYLRDRRRQDRDGCYRQFVEFWQETLREGTWAGLYRMVAGTAAAPDASPQAGREAPA